VVGYAVRFYRILRDLWKNWRDCFSLKTLQMTINPAAIISVDQGSRNFFKLFHNSSRAVYRT